MYNVNTGSPATVQRMAHKVALAVVMTFALVMLGAGHVAYAAPAPPDSSRGLLFAQNVDYIGSSGGAKLNLNFPVLVPGWVPAPFSGSPSIDAGSGYYNLYWMNSGGEPTFLQISGVVGGRLPVASPYDLNNELSINASVNGNGAVRDETPIYDAVWWIQGGVLYSVQSRNMTGADSLGLANSLITFVPPAAPPATQAPVVPTPVPSVPTPAPTQVAPTPVPSVPTPASTQVAPPTNGGSGEPTPVPQASTNPTVGNETEQTVDGPTGVATATETADTGDTTGTTDTAAVPEPTALPTSITSDGTGSVGFSSDGTGGPPVEVVATDGTGGAEVIVIPRRGPILQPEP